MTWRFSCSKSLACIKYLRRTVLTIYFPFNVQNIKEGIDGRPVSWYSDIFSLVFKDLDVNRAMTLWQKQLAKPAKESKDEDGNNPDEALAEPEKITIAS